MRSGRPGLPEDVLAAVCAGERLAQLTALDHDREPPLYRTAALYLWCIAHCHQDKHLRRLPTWREQAGDLHRTGARADDLAHHAVADPAAALSLY
jgi:hypothetical protein